LLFNGVAFPQAQRRYSLTSLSIHSLVAAAQVHGAPTCGRLSFSHAPAAHPLVSIGRKSHSGNPLISKQLRMHASARSLSKRRRPSWRISRLLRSAPPLPPSGFFVHGSSSAEDYRRDCNLRF